MSDFKQVPIVKEEFRCEGGVVTGASAQVALWVNRKLGRGLVLVPCVAIGVVHPTIRDEQVDEVNLPNQLLAGAIFYNYRNDGEGSDVYLTAYTDAAVTGHPDVIRKVLEYPFERWKVRGITAEIDAGNARSIRNAEMMGFKHEGTRRKRGSNGSDILIYGLLPEECPIWNRRAA